MKIISISFSHNVMVFRNNKTTNEWYLTTDEQSKGEWISRLILEYKCENGYQFNVLTPQKTINNAREIWRELLNDNWRIPTKEELEIYELKKAQDNLTYGKTLTIPLGSILPVNPSPNNYVLSIHGSNNQSSCSISDEGVVTISKSGTPNSTIDLKILQNEIEELKRELKTLKEKQEIMTTIYLAGPMDFVTCADQTDWRETAKKDLYRFFDFLDPCRRPHTFDLNPKEIFNLDMEDVRKADILLVDCRNHGVPTFGTPCEVFYASYVLKKTVIGWHDEHKPMNGKGIFQKVLIDRVFDSLQKSLSHLKQYYV